MNEWTEDVSLGFDTLPQVVRLTIRVTYSKDAFATPSRMAG